MKFQATILQSGKTATGIVVPPEVMAALGSSKKPAVKVTFAGHTYRTTVAVMGGDFMIPVSAEIRGITGVSGGDAVEVEIVLDTEPREIAVPSDFADALDKEPEAKEFFEKLSYSNKRRFVLSIEDAKTPETRQRRIEKSVSALKEGKTQ
ncbi:MAG: DUF1905 domain-containing protein [Chlorobia bacterium]|nr:DUF1905 domain-containing protein [Fimbriimonadaceae bacterium]